MGTTERKIRLHSIIAWILKIFIALFAAAVLFVCIVRGVTYYSNHINTANGVDESIYVELNGQEQYLLIRGEDINNKIIIWLHGGPSSPDAFINYSFQKYLVDEYTFVNWDQRGCGRTYFRNIENDPENETASFEQAQNDLDRLVDYVCDRFNTEKVIIVGHSYGTLLGSKYALSHPEKVAAYIGVGQFVNIESDIYSYKNALEIAKTNGDNTDALEKAYAAFVKDKTLTDMMNLRGLVSQYHPAEKQADTLWLSIASPYMGVDDLRWFLKQTGDFEEYISLNQRLFDYLMISDVRDYGQKYQVPVGFISGADDWTTPVKYSEDYFAYIDAPNKDFVLMEGCGHSPQYDDSEEFSRKLKNMLDNFSK